MIQSRVPFKNCTWLYFKAELYLKTPRTPNAKYPKEAENFCTENDNCDVARITHHKSFLSISSSVFPHSLSFFQIKTSQPSIILMGHTQYRAKRAIYASPFSSPVNCLGTFGVKKLYCGTYILRIRGKFSEIWTIPMVHKCL